MARAEEIPLEQFFAERKPESRELFDVVRKHIEALDGVEMRVTKSQIAWKRRVAFAWVWVSSQYLGERAYFPPLVLSVGLKRHDDSPRWEQVVEPSAGRFMHHLELRDASEIDAEVDAWLREAWSEAE